jgi:enterochelin esterase-like enzyme
MTHELIQRAQTDCTPLIDGNTATFVWHGSRPPQVIGDFTHWDSGPAQPFTRLGRGVWSCTITIPSDAYLEYIFILDGERLPDPFNPRTTPNGYGKTNHYFYMPAGSPTALARRVRSNPQGRITRHVVWNDPSELITGSRRTVYLYQPPVDEPAPLLVVWDGSDYLRRARLPVLLDNLIAQKRIRPLALCMIQNGGPARTVEYACNDATLGFLTRSVIPLAQANLRLNDPHQGEYGVLGASMGGLMALYTGLRLPERFNRVISQSGAFSREEYDPVVYDLIRYIPIPRLKIWMDVGAYDFPELLSANRTMATLLQARGYNVALRQYNAGHNYPAWRDDLVGGLEALFG